MGPRKAAAFEEALGPHLPAAVNLARWLIKNPQDAEDVVQEACLRAFACFDRFRGSSPRGWLLTIVRNACHSYFRRGNAAVPQQFDEERHTAADGRNPEGPEAKLLQSAEGKRINDAVLALAVEHREVFILRELEGLSYREIAEVAEVPIGTVMSRLSRARAELQRKLGLEGGEP
jgi:RNA polymerase sigma-70 factor, ECF subfamily